MRVLILAVVIASTLSACVSATDSGADASYGTQRSVRQKTEQVADAAYSVGNYDEAARLYERASEAQPGSVTTLLGLGKSYTALGQYSRAASALAAARRASPGRPEVHSQLGKLALLQGKGTEAYTHYKDALRRAPRDLAGLTGSALALDYLSRHAEAQVVYTRALAVYPTNFALLNNASLSRAISGDHEGAAKVLEELTRDATQGQQARANLAIVYTLAGRSGDARAALKGFMNASEIRSELALWETARQKRLAGEPIGHLIFQ